MLLSIRGSTKYVNYSQVCLQVSRLPKCFLSTNLDSKYTDIEKQKILEVINNNDIESLSRYEISKARLKKIEQHKSINGVIKSISDIEYVEGFSQRTAKKFFNSILLGPSGNSQSLSKIKGHILNPHLSESDIQNANLVLSIYVTVNSVSWLLIEKSSYEVLDWQYHSIDFPEEKKSQITCILDISWRVTRRLPHADLCVMKAEPTTLRAAGSDPNNPKVISVNLQKAQMLAMMIALINARSDQTLVKDDDVGLKQKVYFLRSTLPYRLYGTLVGNERVSTDQTVEMLLKDLSTKCLKKSHAFVPEHLQAVFRSQKDLPKDMMGHCLLLGLTFMDLCIYKNEERITKLNSRI